MNIILKTSWRVPLNCNNTDILDFMIIHSEWLKLNVVGNCWIPPKLSVTEYLWVNSPQGFESVKDSTYSTGKESLKVNECVS